MKKFLTILMIMTLCFAVGKAQPPYIVPVDSLHVWGTLTIKPTLGDGDLQIMKFKNTTGYVGLAIDRATGTVDTVDLDDLATFLNGLTFSNDTIYWDGVLTKNTTIDGFVNTYSVDFDALSQFDVSTGSTGITLTDGSNTIQTGTGVGGDIHITSSASDIEIDASSNELILRGSTFEVVTGADNGDINEILINTDGTHASWQPDPFVDSLFDATTSTWLYDVDTITANYPRDSFSIDLDSLYWYQNGSPKDAFHVGDHTGWAVYNDTFYVEASPLSVATTDTVIMPNNALDSITTYLPAHVDQLYNSSTGLVGELGASYTIRIDFHARTSVVSDYAIILFDIGTNNNNPIIILEKIFTFPKGQNTWHTFSETISYYSLSTFVANGCRIRVVAGGGTLDLAEASYKITKISSP